MASDTGEKLRRNALRKVLPKVLRKVLRMRQREKKTKPSDNVSNIVKRHEAQDDSNLSSII